MKISMDKVLEFFNLRVSDKKKLDEIINESNLHKLNYLMRGIIALPNSLSLKDDISKAIKFETLYMLHSLKNKELEELKIWISLNSKIRQLDAVDETLLLVDAMAKCTDVRFENFDVLLIQKTKMPVLCLVNISALTDKMVKPNELEEHLITQYDHGRSSGVSIFLEATTAKESLIRSLDLEYSQLRFVIGIILLVIYFLYLLA